MNQTKKKKKKTCLKKRCYDMLTLTWAVERKEIDMSTEKFMGRPSSWITAPPTSSTRVAIAPLANFPLLSCKRSKANMFTHTKSTNKYHFSYSK